MNPYEKLAIPQGPDDSTITQAHKSLIRQYPPRRFPEESREIKQAYDKIGSKKGGWNTTCFAVRKGHQHLI